MLYTESMVRMNIRTREGKRVFYLGKSDTLTPGARDWLSRERIPVLPAQEAKPEEYRLLNGAAFREKPEHMTHLHSNVLVPKTHPRIRVRGQMDDLEAELLLCQLECPRWEKELGEILDLAREIIRYDVLGEPANREKLCGLTESDYYGQTHFMPDLADGPVILHLNRCRTAARAAELAAAAAFTDENGNCTREDLLKLLNRMSSMIYILMIREKADRDNLKRGKL